MDYRTLPLSELPALVTPRLSLRPFRESDAPQVQWLAGDAAIASTTLSIPHPYPEGMAAVWIDGHASQWQRGEGVRLAMTLREDTLPPGGTGHATGTRSAEAHGSDDDSPFAADSLIGAIGLTANQPHRHAELGYWVGRPYWGHGYCTEAVYAVLGFGFENLDLHRIFARHLVRNPASGRVMQKTGMLYEGRMREHVLKWGAYEDVDLYGILRSEYEGIHAP